MMANDDLAIAAMQAKTDIPVKNADGTYNDDYIREITKHRVGTGRLVHVPHNTYGAVAQNRLCDYDDV